MLAQAVVSKTSVFDVGLDGLAYNLTFESLGLVIGLTLGLVPLGLWALRFIRFSLSRSVKTFLALWALPPLLLYAVSHVGQYGYLLVVLPPLAILSGLCARVFGLAWAGRYRKRRLDFDLVGAKVGLAICGAIGCFSMLYFLLAEDPVTASGITRMR